MAQPAAAPKSPWCPAKWRATPPAAASFRQLFASADDTVAKTRARATQPINVLVFMTMLPARGENYAGIGAAHVK